MTFDFPCARGSVLCPITTSLDSHLEPGRVPDSQSGRQYRERQTGRTDIRMKSIQPASHPVESRRTNLGNKPQTNRGSQHRLLTKIPVTKIKRLIFRVHLGCSQSVCNRTMREFHATHTSIESVSRVSPLEGNAHHCWSVYRSSHPKSLSLVI